MLEGMFVEVRLSKQAQKYLSRTDDAARKKLYNALDGLSRFEGDIVPLRGIKETYRLKIPHYRIIFRLENGAAVVFVIEINVRTNIKYNEFRRRK